MLTRTASTYFLETPLGKKILVLETDLMYPSKMGANCELDLENIISATIEELTKDERQDYLMAEEHFRAQSLKGFKKDRSGQVKRVQDVVMPAFTLKDKQIKVTGNVSAPSPLVNQFLSLIGDKIAESNKNATDLLLNLTDYMHVMSKRKGVDHSCSTETLRPISSATPASASQTLYGMPPNYFDGQTPPPQSVQPSMAEPVRPVRWWPA